MKKTVPSRPPLLALLAVGVVLAACGGSATTTDAPPSTTSAPVVEVDASAETFASLAAMERASDLIAVGTVVEVTEGRFSPAPAGEDFKGTQSLRIVIRVDEVLEGDTAPGESVSIGWAGYDVGLDGSRGPQMIVDGQPPPEVGDRNLWFLSRGPDGYGLVAFEGRLIVDDSGTLSLPAPVGSGAAREIDGLQLEDLAKALAADA